PPMITPIQHPPSFNSSNFGCEPSVPLLTCGMLLRALMFLSIPATIMAATPLPRVSTERHTVTNTYHGLAVKDDYQWLEDPSAPGVREWMQAQNARTRAYFTNLPFRDGIAQQLLQLRSEESARVFGLAERKGKIFALRFKPPAQQPVLVQLSSI